MLEGGQLAAKAVDQERAAKYLLAALEETPPDHPDIDDMIARLVHDGRAHIEYEQNEVWPRLRESVDSEELDDLGTRMAAAKKHAPTRPHPETPPSRAALNTSAASPHSATASGIPWATAESSVVPGRRVPVHSAQIAEFGVPRGKRGGEVDEFDIEVLRSPAQQVEGFVRGQVLARHQDALGLSDDIA